MNPLTPRDRRTIVAAVKETALRHFRADGWEPGPIHDGYVMVSKRFASNTEIKQQLEIFSDYRITAWVR